LQLGATREAFLAAGAPADKAAAAAEELAAFEGQQSRIENRLAHVDQRLDRMDLRLGHMDWKINAMLTVLVLMLGSQFLLWSKVGEMSGQISQILARLH